MHKGKENLYSELDKEILKTGGKNTIKAKIHLIPGRAISIQRLKELGNFLPQYASFQITDYY